MCSDGDVPPPFESSGPETGRKKRAYSRFAAISVSGRDHGQLPYEVRVALIIETHLVDDLRERIADAGRLYFQQPLPEFGLRIKGSRLLKANCYEWAGELSYFRDNPAMARSFVTDQRNHGSQPYDMQYASYGASCIGFVDRVLGEARPRFEIAEGLGEALERLMRWESNGRAFDGLRYLRELPVAG